MISLNFALAELFTLLMIVFVVSRSSNLLVEFTALQSCLKRRTKWSNPTVRKATNRPGGFYIEKNNRLIVKQGKLITVN